MKSGKGTADLELEEEEEEEEDDDDDVIVTKWEIKVGSW
jgi:hypothetical protein